MKISNLITEKYPSINDDQKKIIEHDNGPLLVIAGPGSGKTFSIVLRAINLILNGLAKPSEIMVRLYYEMDINMEGIETINHLLNRMNEMQQEIVKLQNRLGVYEGE